MNNIFDSHAHYDDPAFDPDRAELLSSLPSEGVCGVITCGCTPDGSRAALGLARSFPFIYAACGIHPQDAAGCGDDRLDEIASLLGERGCVAVGEIGLDYHYDGVPREEQLRVFDAQLELSVKAGLPVIVHDREAHGDTMELLRKHRPRGVLHCYSGSLEMLRDVLELGLYVGLGGAVTFKNARKPLDTAKFVPLERLLLETDCPYMAPVPHRGHRCHSGMIALTARRIAEARGEDTQALLDATAQNARSLFNIQN